MLPKVVRCSPWREPVNTTISMDESNIPEQLMKPCKYNFNKNSNFSRIKITVKIANIKFHFSNFKSRLKFP